VDTIRIGRVAAETTLDARTLPPHTATYVAGIFNSPLVTGSGAHPVYVNADGQLVSDQLASASVTPEEFKTMQQTIEEQKATIEQQRAEFETKVAQQQKT
jgi:hypothetical protein